MTYANQCIGQANIIEQKAYMEQKWYNVSN